MVIFMNKKLMAVFCIAVLMVSVFAACGKKAQTVNIDGVEYPVATDDEGNTILSDDGEIAVYVTDANGKYVKDANGERQTNLVDFPNRLVSGNVIETPAYRWVFPKTEGWTLSSRGIAYKDGTENNVYVKVLEVDPNGKRTLEENVNQTLDMNNKQMEEVKKTYPDSAVEVKDVKFSDDSIEGKCITVYVKDTNGKMLQYVDGIYFEVDGKTYKIEYASTNGHYDETVDLFAMLKNFKIKASASAK